MNPSLIDFLAVSGILAIWVAIIVLVKKSFGRDREKEELRRRISELKDELEKTRKHYEGLLKDSAIKNAMMLGLWNAYVSGKLHECYKQGGKLRILADGTCICEIEEEPEKSYTIVKGEE